MRKFILIVGILTISATASAISQGPGGRLYMTERVEVEEDEFTTNSYISLKSYKLDADWNIVGTASPDGSIAPNNHGLILDNHDGHLGYKDNWGISPEIETGAGDGFGATLVMGANYNQSPASNYPTYEVMDLIGITTSDGGSTIELLGTGRVGHPEGWYSPSGNFGHTDRGDFAAPDPGGGFLNAGEYLVHGQDYRSYFSVVTDANSDGDSTDSDEDYLTFTTDAIRYPEDFEIVGDKLWIANRYNNIGGDGIWYYQRRDDGTIADKVRFLQNDTSRTELGQNGLTPYSYAMVKGTIDGHDAIWTINFSQPFIEDVQPSRYDLLLAIDLNDDGDAMDVGEVSLIYSNDSASGTWNDAGNTWGDMELIEHDGKKFLMVEVTDGHWIVPRSLFVLELLDNGDYAGGDESAHLICVTDLGGTGSDWEVLSEIEFDANTGRENLPGDADRNDKIDGADLARWQRNYDPLGLNQNTWEMGDWDGNGTIDGADLAFWQQNYDPIGAGVGAVPEPTTLLLLGTGVLGALGYVRTRRLN